MDENPIPLKWDAYAHEPNLARINDWVLDGTNNTDIDRLSGADLERIVPEIRKYARESRQFLRRAVWFAVMNGIRQFIDIGSGLPTQGNVHEIADECRPQQDTNVVYVDNDAITHFHATQILEEFADWSRHRVVHADLLRSAELWKRVRETGIVDLEAPTCVLVTGLLHFITDGSRPEQHIAYVRDRLAPGSFLVLTHSTDRDVDDSSIREQAKEYYRRNDPGQLRTRDEFARFFTELELVDPGITFAPQWRPDPAMPTPFAYAPEDSHILAAVGCKH